MEHKKSKSFEFHTTRMLEESKKAINDLNFQISDKKTMNLQYTYRLNELTKNKNLLLISLKELETEKNEVISNKNIVLQRKNQLLFDIKQLDNELSRNHTNWEINKKQVENQISFLKNEQNSLNLTKDKENKAFDSELKKLAFDIKVFRDKTEGLEGNSTRYEGFIHEIQEKERISVEMIKKEAEEFRSFIEESEKN